MLISNIFKRIFLLITCLFIISITSTYSQFTEDAFLFHEGNPGYKNTGKIVVEYIGQGSIIGTRWDFSLNMRQIPLETKYYNPANGIPDNIIELEIMNTGSAFITYETILHQTLGTYDFTIYSYERDYSTIEPSRTTKLIYCETANGFLNFAKHSSQDEIQQWQMSSDGINWINTGESDDSYAFNNVTHTTYYRALYSRYQINLFSDDYKIYLYSDVIEIKVIEESRTTEDVDVLGDIYEYDLNLNTSATGGEWEGEGIYNGHYICPVKFERDIPYEYTYTNDCITRHITFKQNTGINRVVEHSIYTSQIHTKEDVNNLLEGPQKNTNIQYYNGLGDVIQTKAVGAGGNGEDIIQQVLYNNMRQVNTSYIAMPHVSSNDYSYTEITSTDIINAYNQYELASDIVLNPEDVRSNVEYEQSPRGRVLHAKGPGNAWREHNVQTSNYYALIYQIETFVNTHEELESRQIKAFEIRQEDENGKIVKTYKNQEGQDIIQIDSDGNKTEYVYDIYGNLRYVFPPLYQENKNTTDCYSGSYNPLIITINNYTEQLIEYNEEGEVNIIPNFEFDSYELGGEFTVELGNSETTARPCSVIDEYAFQYKYDGKNRLVEKKEPGKEPIYYIYDNAGNLILSQDGNLRGEDSEKWRFSKYDYQKRVIMTGTIHLPFSSNREMYQRDVISGLNVNYYESPSTEVDNIYGYTNIGIISLLYIASLEYVGASIEYETVNYYDDYNHFPNNFVSMPFIYNPVCGYVTANLTKVKGLSTGSMIRKLEGNTLGDWICSVVYYNERYEPIETITQNQSGGLDYAFTSYDFDGTPLRSRIEHYGLETIKQEQSYSYDHQNRLLRTYVSINDDYTSSTCFNNKYHVISENTYDALGRLKQKDLDGYNSQGVSYVDPLQTIDYRYNVRGLLTHINNPDNLGTNDLFAQKINYTDFISELGQNASNIQFNGNVSSVVWATQEGGKEAYAFKYDNKYQLSSAKYGYGATIVADNKYSEQNITYDSQGNITGLERYGNIDNGDLMDKLTYGYKGNKLITVLDNGDKNKGFKESSELNEEYEYDSNGNMIKDANTKTKIIRYNMLDLPYYFLRKDFEEPQPDGTIKTVDFQETYITYTILGEKLTYEVTTLYTDGTSENLYKKFDGICEYNGISQNNLFLNYVLQPEGRIRVSKSNDELQFTYEYFICDYLGNVRVVFDAKQVEGGNWYEKEAFVFQNNDYYPFGLQHEQEQIEGTQGQGEGQKYLYGGKELYSNLDLYDFHARLYNPALGRWSVMDPANQFVNFSPYGYAANNPVVFTDPDGEFIGIAMTAITIWAVTTESGYEAQKFISPFAVHFDIHLGSEQKGLGVDISVGVPKLYPISYRVHGGATYYWQYYDNSNNKGLEMRYGGEWTFGGVVSYSGTTFKSGETSQTTGMFTIGGPLFNLKYENDMMFGFKLLGVPEADGGDRYRTASTRIKVGCLQVGLNLFTGDPGLKQKDRKRNLDKGGKYGLYEKNDNEDDPNKYRAGVVYFGIGAFKFGLNSEANRNFIQNKIIHNHVSKSPYFLVLDRKPSFFWYYGSGTGDTLW